MQGSVALPEHAPTSAGRAIAIREAVKGGAMSETENTPPENTLLGDPIVYTDDLPHIEGEIVLMTLEDWRRWCERGERWARRRG